MACDVEKISRDIIVAVEQHAGNRQRVATVIARACEDDDPPQGAPVFDDGLGEGLRCAFHQVDGLDGLVFNRIFVQFADLDARENLHNGAKVGKRFGDSKSFS